MPTTNTIGKNTTTVVSVDAIMAFATSLAPVIDASFSSFPSSLCLDMFSSTTIALSTSMPTPSASPPRLIIFIESLPIYIKVNTAIIDIGILTVTMIELLTFLKKSNSTKNASTPPCIAASRTPLMESFINFDWSYIIPTFISLGTSSLIKSNAFLTLFTTCSVFACACFCIDIAMFSERLYLEKLVLSFTVSLTSAMSFSRTSLLPLLIFSLSSSSGYPSSFSTCTATSPISSTCSNSPSVLIRYS